VKNFIRMTLGIFNPTDWWSMRISSGHGGLRASVIMAIALWPSLLNAHRLTAVAGRFKCRPESENGNGTTATSNASQVIEIVVIVGGVPLSQSRRNRAMPR